MIYIQNKEDQSKLLVIENNTPSSLKMKNSVSKTSTSFFSPSETISSKFMEKVNILKDEIIKFKYPINSHLAYKIKDINDVNRMLKPSQHIIKNKYKYLKLLNIDLYEKNDKEIINYPKLKDLKETEFDKDNKRLIEKISFGSTYKNETTAGVNKLLENKKYITIESQTKFYPNKTKPNNDNALDSTTNKSTEYWNESKIRKKIRLSISKYTNTDFNATPTLITQREKFKFSSHSQKNVILKTINFSNTNDLKFKKPAKSKQGNLISNYHQAVLLNTFNDSKKDKKNDCNLDLLGENNLILAKIQISAKNKNKIRLETVNEIKTRKTHFPFLRSRYIHQEFNNTEFENSLN